QKRAITSAGIPSTRLFRAIRIKGPPLLRIPSSRHRFDAGPLVPSVKTREVTCIPCLAKPRSTQIPVWADFTRHDAQVMPKIDDRRTPPEPVTFVDAVNH